MLRISPPLSVGQASHYYKSEFSRGDYYTEGEEGIVRSRWHGTVARELGLEGRVKSEQLTLLLEGRDLDGNVLVAHREGLAERRAAWDMTVSPHKSVSLAALVGGDARLFDAHDRAVGRAIVELERHAQAWIHGGRDVETTGNLAVASFRHETSRALDPQLHTHCVFLNMTKRSDGEWRAVDGRGVFRAQKLLREIYETELRRELVKLGYEVQTYRDGREGRDRAVGIAGFREDHLEHFSKRSREIQKALERDGLKSRLHGSRVTVATRASKAKGIDRGELVWHWRSVARDMGMEFPKWGPAREEERGAVRTATREAVSDAVEHLSERRTVFALSALEHEALARGRERGVTLNDVRNEIESRPDLVVADAGDRVRARVTTAQAIEQERALVALAERGRGSGLVARRAFEGRGLGEDQLRVARHILTTPDRIVAVEGKAGTGKSTTLSAVREHAWREGWTVRGFAPTTTAAGVLREGGIEAVTVAAALKEERGGVRGPELWVVDEAGLLSTRQAHDLLERAAHEGVKAVLVGDREQHRAVEAGSPFALLMERGGLKTERLDHIRRQKDEQLRAAVEAASERGGVGRAVQLLEQAGRVLEIPDMRARHERITRDFMEDGGRGVVIAPSNLERHDLNRRIRESLIEHGQVERKSVKAQVVVRQDFTAEQKTHAVSYREGDVLRFVRGGDGIDVGQRARVVGIDEGRNRLRVEVGREVREINPKERRGFEVERLDERRFAVGDRIQFRQKDRALGVTNGTVGTIRKLDHARGVAVVDVGGRSLRLDLKEPRALDHAYAVTSHRSQGLSRERVYLTVDTRHSEELVNRRQFYVSVSRAVQDAKVYTDDRGQLVRAASREQGRESALDVAERKGPRADRPVKERLPERPIEVAERSREHERREPARNDRGIDRAADGRGRAAAPGGRDQAGAGAERGRAAGAQRVPGSGAERAALAGRAADRAVGRGGGAPEPAAVGRAGEAAGDRGRDGRAALSRAEPSRAAADGRGRGGDGVRGLSRGASGDVDEPKRGRAAGDGERERADRGRGAEERAASAQPHAGEGAERDPRRRTRRALSREEIEASPALTRAYAAEYRETLRVVPDRELAREVARVNLSAKERGEAPVVTKEVAERVGLKGLREALDKGDDLGRLRTTLTPAPLARSRANERSQGYELER